MTDPELFACFPPGLLAKVADVLRAGGAAKGVGPLESPADQGVEYQLGHAIDHLYAEAMGDTREPHLVHAIARCALAYARGLEVATVGEAR